MAGRYTAVVYVNHTIERSVMSSIKKTIPAKSVPAPAPAPRVRPAPMMSSGSTAAQIKAPTIPEAISALVLQLNSLEDTINLTSQRTQSVRPVNASPLDLYQVPAVEDGPSTGFNVITSLVYLTSRASHLTNQLAFLNDQLET